MVSTTEPSQTVSSLLKHPGFFIQTMCQYMQQLYLKVFPYLAKWFEIFPYYVMKVSPQIKVMFTQFNYFETLKISKQILF